MTEAVSTSTPTPQDTYIDSLGYTLEAWLAMTDDQQRAIIEQKLAGKTDEEQDELFRAIGSECNELQESLEDVYNNFEDLIDEMPVDQQATAQALLEQLQQLIDSCDTVQPEVRDFMGIHNDHNIDVGASGQTVEGDDFEYDGGTYTYTFDGSGGTAPNPFSDGLTDDEWLREEHYTNEFGEMTREVDGTPGIDYNDREAALAQRHAGESAGPPFTMNLGDRQPELVSADAETGEYTFKITNADGSFCYIKLNNFANGRLFLNFTASPEMADIIANVWPTELRERTFWAGQAISIEETLHPEDTDSARREAIRGYHNISEVAPSSLGSYTGGLPSSLRDEYDEAVNALFDAYDRGDDPETVWQEIFDSWGDLTHDEKAILSRNLVCAFFRYNQTAFKDRFGNATVIRQLESFLTPEGSSSGGIVTYSDYDQIAIYILETQSGGIGNYGGIGILDPENTSVPILPDSYLLGQIQTLVSLGGGSLANFNEAITAARERETGVSPGESAGAATGGTTA